MSEYDHLFKLVLVGDSGVGKSNLLSQYTRNEFSNDSVSTIGVEFATRIIVMDDGARIKAQIWDTAGQERYRAITTAYYRGAMGAILVYDLTKQDTFDNIPRWIRELNDVMITLVGNKLDLCESGAARQVAQAESNAFSSDHKYPLLEASAKTGVNVIEAFESTVKRIYANATARQLVAQPQQGVVKGGAPAAVKLGSQDGGPNRLERCCSRN